MDSGAARLTLDAGLRRRQPGTARHVACTSVPELNCVLSWQGRPVWRARRISSEGCWPSEQPYIQAYCEVAEEARSRARCKSTVYMASVFLSFPATHIRLRLSWRRSDCIGADSNAGSLLRWLGQRCPCRKTRCAPRGVGPNVVYIVYQIRKSYWPGRV